MRASILKTMGVLALALCGLGLSGCCNCCQNCNDPWERYQPCDLIEGQQSRDCAPSCDPCG